MDTNELPSEPSSVNLEARVGFLSELGKAAKEALEWYFEPRAFERWGDGLLYKVLGVHYFKKIVPTSGEYVNRIIGYHPIRNASSREEGLKECERYSRIFEAIHVPGLVITLSLVPYVNTGITIMNLAINLYPSLLQRYNRAKIYNALEKLNADASNIGEEK